MRRDYLTRWKPEGDEALPREPLTVKVPLYISDAVKALPGGERSKWLRRVITDAAERELLDKSPNQVQS